MFHQNSNDLVKNASLKSGHLQHSKETQQLLASQQVMNQPKDDNGGPAVGADGGAGASLSIGTQFQNMIQSLVGEVFSIKEGLSTPADPSTGIGGDGKTSQANFINSQAAEDKKYTEQELSHIKRVDGIMKLIERDDKNRRQNWVEVTDAAGITKYGYITKDGVFQIWHVPASPSSNPSNWLQTDKMKQNTGVIGCPAPSGGATQKIKIAGKWDDIKPYDLVYSDTDSSRLNPLFMVINDVVRDPRNTPGGRGLFSCGNERGNVYVKERPSADFQFPGQGVDTIQMGCYLLGDDVKDSDLANRGFTFQDDLSEASISQCKRRAEDLGSSYFLVGAPEPGKPNNRGGCWIYTSSGKPNINNFMVMSADESKCHNVNNKESDEDGYLKAYASTTLKRLYGKNHQGSSTSYISKRSGMWAGEGANEYTCNGARGRNTTGNWGDFNRYCIFDSADDAQNWCSSDPTCVGYMKQHNKFQVTRKPVVNPYGGTYFEKNAEAKTTRAVALYSLKMGGPTGVDEVGRGGRGYVGRIAYIDHNGERHDYPASALSMMPPSKDEKGNTLPATYLNLGGYDTRSAESSYSLKEITPGSFSEASNLLYKASRDGWSPAAFHQRCDNKGATYTRAILNDGRVLGAYTSLSWSSSISSYQHDTTAFLYDGTTKFPSTNSVWGSGMYATYMNSGYYPTFGGGHDFYIWGQNMYNNAFTFTTSDGRAPFGRSRYTYQQYALRDLEVYSVDANTFPRTNPPEYSRRLRTMPVGESVTASFEKCRGMCDADEKCGGFVYTKGSAGADGKCELKDRAKMYPVGLRVADPTKQLMLKVPTINGSVGDETCKGAGGGGGSGGDVYKMIDSAQYSHYPDTGSMSSSSKCNLRHIVPKKGTLAPTDLKSMFGAVDKEFDETEKKTTEYRNQTAIKAPPQSDTTEGMTVQSEDSSSTYGEAMKGVQDSLKRIANSKYQRERLIAMTEESNKNLISESYKFILWSVLAILAVLALLKLKEMFGQDDADEDGGADGGDAGGGLLATILAWFGVKSVSTSDIPDRTQDVKAALSSAGEQLQETGTSIATSITEGADNLVNSANEMAAGAVEGATSMVDKAKETASNAIDQAGSAASSMMSSSSGPTAAPTTGGGGRKGGSATALKSKKK